MQDSTVVLLSTPEMRAILEEGSSQIIDIRPVAAYNGWRLKNELRGGHIRGARSLPHKWSKYIDWIEIVHHKGIVPEEHIVLYGYSLEQCFDVAHRFNRVGYQNIAIYPHFLSQWVPDRDLPLVTLPRYRQLVHPQWLKELIEEGSAPEYDSDRFVICHVHYQNPEDYAKGHIPGAIALDTNMLESSETWNRRSPEELKAALESLGISSKHTVICYGRFSFPDNNDPFPGSSAGHLGSMRAAAIMLYAGVEDVRILNGGIHSWEEAKFPLSTDVETPRAVDNFGCEIPANPHYFIDTPQAEEYLASPMKNLVSVRSWPEYIGLVSGYHYIEIKGRIPGSVFGNCGSDAYHMENYRNLDHTIREFQEIEAMWREIGVTPEKHNAFYCGTGWRGSEAFINAWLMGWKEISVYDGGWFEWSNSGRPYETGEPAAEGGHG